MERLALEEARVVEPPAELRDEVWKALEAAILPAAATVATVGALSEGASAGSHAAATTVAGSKAAIGAATHMGFAALPALKVVATAAFVLGSTAGVGFAVGRGWSALTETGVPEESRVAEAHPPRATSVVAGSRAAARGVPESLVASEAREALRAGDPRRSVALLQRLQSLGGKGVLAEERGLLEIEALVWATGMQRGSAPAHFSGRGPRACTRAACRRCCVGFEASPALGGCDGFGAVEAFDVGDGQNERHGAVFGLSTRHGRSDAPSSAAAPLPSRAHFRARLSS